MLGGPCLKFPLKSSSARCDVDQPFLKQVSTLSESVTLVILINIPTIPYCLQTRVTLIPNFAAESLTVELRRILWNGMFGRTHSWPGGEIITHFKGFYDICTLLVIFVCFLNVAPPATQSSGLIQGGTGTEMGRGQIQCRQALV